MGRGPNCSCPPSGWEERLLDAGFAGVDAQVLDAPTPDYIGTLIVRAVVA